MIYLVLISENIKFKSAFKMLYVLGVSKHLELSILVSSIMFLPVIHQILTCWSTKLSMKFLRPYIHLQIHFISYIE